MSGSKGYRRQHYGALALAVAFAGPHRPVVAFRNIFDGDIRDHAVVTFADAQTPGPLYRVSVDDWKIDACPHQGPSLAIGWQVRRCAG